MLSWWVLYIGDWRISFHSHTSFFFDLPPIHLGWSRQGILDGWRSLSNHRRTWMLLRCPLSAPPDLCSCPHGVSRPRDPGLFAGTGSPPAQSPPLAVGMRCSASDVIRLWNRVSCPQHIFGISRISLRSWRSFPSLLAALEFTLFFLSLSSWNAYVNLSRSKCL